MSTAQKNLTVPEDTSGSRAGKPSGPCAIIIFGATGDLTARKLVPALHNLMKSNLLSKEFAIIGVAFDEGDKEHFRQKVTRFLDKEDHAGEEWKWFYDRFDCVKGDFKDPQLYLDLKAKLEEVDRTQGTQGNYLFYLSVAPAFFSEIPKQLEKIGLTDESKGNWRRVIIEKPFGHDLESAKSLNREVKSVLREDQIYRIDHYLGKETVQNILVFRFANGIFEPIWNRQYIDHVQITVAETVGVELRGGYFESSGTLRDMVPNHILQLITLTTMEPPISFSADAMHDEQAKILHAIQPMNSEDVLMRSVRGQYGAGVLGGEQVPAYRAEPAVSPESKTETFVALKLLIDNWRWAGVPIYLRTGKRMATRHTEIAIQFKRAPFVLFRDTSVEKLDPNHLVMYIAPDEGIALRFGAKIPGPVVHIGAVDMDFHYTDYFGVTPSTGYEVLIYDCMIGDATLFQRADMVEAGWSVVDPVLDVWKALPARSFPNYAAGSWGPKESADLLARDGRHWRTITK